MNFLSCSRPAMHVVEPMWIRLKRDFNIRKFDVHILTELIIVKTLSNIRLCSTAQKSNGSIWTEFYWHIICIYSVYELFKVSSFYIDKQEQTIVREALANEEKVTKFMYVRTSVAKNGVSKWLLRHSVPIRKHFNTYCIFVFVDEFYTLWALSVWFARGLKPRSLV